MSKLYSCRPSELLGINDSYTAFCFDEACSLIRIKLDEGEEPVFLDISKRAENKEYKSFTDFYKQYE